MSPHILFVDDEIPIRELLALCFKRKGMSVTVAATGADALRLAQTIPFELVILDVDLGGEDGLELLDVFKRNYPKTPVIMFTSMGDDPALLKDALTRGATAWMAKTEPLDKLMAEVQRALA
jgi:DNA-binding response OmpR family regulator